MHSSKRGISEKEGGELSESRNDSSKAQGFVDGRVEREQLKTDLRNGQGWPGQSQQRIEARSHESATKWHSSSRE